VSIPPRDSTLDELSKETVTKKAEGRMEPCTSLIGYKERDEVRKIKE
jgi:hypothetical protein